MPVCCPRPTSSCLEKKSQGRRSFGQCTCTQPLKLVRWSAIVHRVGVTSRPMTGQVFRLTFFFPSENVSKWTFRVAEKIQQDSTDLVRIFFFFFCRNVRCWLIQIPDGCSHFSFYIFPHEISDIGLFPNCCCCWCDYLRWPRSCVAVSVSRWTGEQPPRALSWRAKHLKSRRWWHRLRIIRWITTFWVAAAVAAVATVRSSMFR